MSIIGIDPQIAGVIEDGSPGGAVRAVLTHGDAVEVPFRTLEYYAEVNGGAGATFQTTGLYSNPDGSGTGLSVTVPTDVTVGAGVRIWLPFYGRIFGVRWRRDAATTASGISVVVDGVAVAVTPVGLLPGLTDEGITTQISDTRARAITHRNLLDDGPHVAEITIGSVPSAVSTIMLYGYIADGRAGYQPLPRVAQVVSTTTLTASDVEIPANRSTALAFRAIRRVLYTNITAGPITVTVKNGASIMWQASIPANNSATFDPGGVAASAAFTHAASAAASVTATVIGEY